MVSQPTAAGSPPPSTTAPPKPGKGKGSKPKLKD
jgi:hypothetical protein